MVWGGCQGGKDWWCDRLVTPKAVATIPNYFITAIKHSIKAMDLTHQFSPLPILSLIGFIVQIHFLALARFEWLLLDFKMWFKYYFGYSKGLSRLECL